MGEWSTVFSISKAIVEGIVSIPKDLVDGVERTAEDIGLFGKEVQQENALERERLWSLIENVFKSSAPLVTLVEIILTDFFDKVPDEVLEKMINKALPYINQMVIGDDDQAEAAVRRKARREMKKALINLVNRKVVEKAIQRAIAKRIAKIGVGLAVSALLFQGLIEQASDASKRLQMSHPRLHQELKNRDLDMIFFLVEDYLQPFLDAIRLQRNFPSQFDEILERIKTLLDS